MTELIKILVTETGTRTAYNVISVGNYHDTFF